MMKIWGKMLIKVVQILEKEFGKFEIILKDDKICRNFDQNLIDFWVKFQEKIDKILLKFAKHGIIFCRETYAKFIGNLKKIKLTYAKNLKKFELVSKR